MTKRKKVKLLTITKYNVMHRHQNWYQKLLLKNRLTINDSKCKNTYWYWVLRTLQHYDSVLLSKHIANTWKCPLDFPKLKMLRFLVGLSKQEFHLNRNWIPITIHRVRKLKRKTCFPEKWKGKFSIPRWKV